MPSNAWTTLATTTLGSAQSTVTFSNIAGTYRDLVLAFNGSFAVAGNYNLRFNSDTGSNYGYVVAQGNNDNSARSTTLNAITAMPVWEANNFDANTMFNSYVNIFDYAVTDKHKVVISRTSGIVVGSNLPAMACGRWASTSAITSVSVVGSQNFNIGSIFTLYGVSS